MHLDHESLKVLAGKACEAARAGGAVIASYTAGQVAVKGKVGGDSAASQVVTEVDEHAQAVIIEVLASSISEYDCALLTEELADDGSRFEKDYFWCIDPLDGTLPFTQGIPGYSVSIALVSREGRSVIGVVYDPVASKLYCAVEGQGLLIDGVAYVPPMNEPKQEPLRLYCDCTFEAHPDRLSIVAEVESLALRLGYPSLKVEIGGGGVLNACWALENPPAVYFKKPKISTGGGSLWDFAATACIFVEAGSYARDSMGEPLDLNRVESSFMNHRGVCYTTQTEVATAIRQG